MTYQQPIVVDAGLVSVVVPDRAKRLTPRAWADIQLASILADAGRHEPAAALVRQVESRLKVNDAHRRAVRTSPDAVRREIREAARRRRLEAHHLAASAGQKLRDETFAEGIADALQQAHAKRTEAEALRVAGGKDNKKRAKMLKNQAAGLELKAKTLRNQELDQIRLYGAAEDPILRARLRGETVEAYEAETAEVVRDERGARILTSDGLPALAYSVGLRARVLDPLASMTEAGNLNDRQHTTGLSVIGLYELRQSGLGSQMGAIDGVGSPTYDNNATVAHGMEVAQAAQVIGAIERAMLVGQFRNRKGELITVEAWPTWFRGPAAVNPNIALNLMRTVCERGQSIRSLGRNMGTYAPNCRALAMALNLAGAVLKSW